MYGSLNINTVMNILFLTNALKNAGLLSEFLLALVNSKPMETLLKELDNRPKEANIDDKYTDFFKNAVQILSNVSFILLIPVIITTIASKE